MKRRSAGNMDWMLLAAVGVGIAIELARSFDALCVGLLTPETSLFWPVVGVIALVVCLLVDFRVLVARFLVVYSTLVALLALRLLAELFRPIHPRGMVFELTLPWYWDLLPQSLEPFEPLAPIAIAITLASVYGPTVARRRRLRGATMLTVLIAPIALIAYPAFVNSLWVGVVITVFAVAKSRTVAAVVLLPALAALLFMITAAYDFGNYDIRRLAEVYNSCASAYSPRDSVEYGLGGMDSVGLSLAGVLAVVFLIVRAVGVMRVIGDRTGRYIVLGIVADFTLNAARFAWLAWQVATSPWGFVPAGLVMLGLFQGPFLLGTLVEVGLILNVRMCDRINGVWGTRRIPSRTGAPLA